MSNPYSHLRVCDAHHLVAEYRQQSFDLLVVVYMAIEKFMQSGQGDLIEFGRELDRAAGGIEDAIYTTEQEDQAELADCEGWKEDAR